MTKLYVRGFSISLDGFGAGPNQTLSAPMGEGARGLHQWFVATETFAQMFGHGSGTTGVDNDFAARGFANIGANIMGRNMFGPQRDAWSDDTWKGWWDDNPPFHSPVFVLSHHARPPIEMAGGTTFYFVTEGIEVALTRATEAANGQDIRLNGGVATVRQYLSAGLIDELHLVYSPVLLGRGEHLFAGIDAKALGYQCVEHVATAAATHVVLARG